MNGAHDMGGVMGFGPVVPEPSEPVFHAPWEGRVLAMMFAMGGPVMGTSIDQGRFEREDVSPTEYLSRTYYETWFAGLVRMLLTRRLITSEELASGKSQQPGKPERILKPEDVVSALMRRRPYERTIDTPARFRTGERVRARNMHPRGHTRLPRYVRGHVGTIKHVYGAHVFPDSSAAGLGEAPQWLYNVRFTGSELWGNDADPAVTVSVDAWENYLEPIP